MELQRGSALGHLARHWSRLVGPTRQRSRAAPRCSDTTSARQGHLAALRRAPARPRQCRLPRRARQTAATSAGFSQNGVASSGAGCVNQSATIPTSARHSSSSSSTSSRAASARSTADATTDSGQSMQRAFSCSGVRGRSGVGTCLAGWLSSRLEGHPAFVAMFDSFESASCRPSKNCARGIGTRWRSAGQYDHFGCP